MNYIDTATMNAMTIFWKKNDIHKNTQVSYYVNVLIFHLIINVESLLVGIVEFYFQQMNNLDQNIYCCNKTIVITIKLLLTPLPLARITKSWKIVKRLHLCILKWIITEKFYKNISGMTLLILKNITLNEWKNGLTCKCIVSFHDELELAKCIFVTIFRLESISCSKINTVIDVMFKMFVFFQQRFNNWNIQMVFSIQWIKIFFVVMKRLCFQSR